MVDVTTLDDDSGGDESEDGASPSTHGVTSAYWDPSWPTPVVPPSTRRRRAWKRIKSRLTGSRIQRIRSTYEHWRDWWSG